MDIPRYLQLLYLISVVVFTDKGVDVAIYETHAGGEFDATNVVKKPIATGITSISIDHQHLLGDSLDEIAWHKSGIFKTGTPAFSVPQVPQVTQRLNSRARDKNVSLRFVDVENRVKPRHALIEAQRTNCALALELAEHYLQSHSTGSDDISLDVYRAIENLKWPGRFQNIIEKDAEWALDGAHNTAAMDAALCWFQSQVYLKHVCSRTWVLIRMITRVRC